MSNLLIDFVEEISGFARYFGFQILDIHLTFELWILSLEYSRQARR